MSLKKGKPKMRSKMKKQPIYEDFELSDEEPTTINLDEEQKVSSKFITFDCPLCHGKLQLRNASATLAVLNSVKMTKQ